MKRTVGALAALALLSSTAAWAASSHRAPTLRAEPVRERPNFDLSLEAAKRVGPSAKVDQPRFLWNTRDAQMRARSYNSLPAPLAANAQLSGLARGLGLDEVRTMGLSYASINTNALGQNIVHYEQRVGGIEVFRGGASVLLDRSQQAVAFSNRLVPQAFGVRAFDARAFDLSASDAIAISYTDVTGETIASDLFVPASGQGEYVRFTTSSILSARQSFLPTPARAKKVLFPTAHGLVPAWYVEVQAQRPGSRDTEGYAYVVSAVSRPGKMERGKLLMRHNLVADADLVIRAWADTTPPFTPHDGPEGPGATPYPYAAFNPAAPYNPFVPANLVTLPDARTDAARDAWLPADATGTDGNHAFAYADHVAPDYFSAGDIVGEMNLPFGFDYTFDHALSPIENATQIQAAIAQLFYTNNWLHDFFYTAGFDEASGNAQADNFGRGGVDGDPVHAQAQDHSGTDNANMLTPADGTSPRMQMYLFTQLGPWAVEVVDPPDFGSVFANVSSVGPQVFDLTSDVIIGVPNATCGLDNDPTEVAGKAIVIPWGFGTCNPLFFIEAAEAAGAAVSLINYGDPGAPDQAPFIGGDEDLSGIPVIILSLSSSLALEDALQNGPVAIRTAREPSTFLDGTIDNAIVAHEWGHYLTNRLVGNGSGLGTNQARSMGEGWSDFVSLLMTTRAEDAANANNVDWSGAFAMSTYATRGFNEEWAGYFGIRRLPYSVDRTKNPLTFRHIDNSQAIPFEEAPILDLGDNASVHNSGEVWATTLWEGYVALLRAHPFEEAQTRMKNYLVAGLKLTPIQPTFTEARDALLAAVYANDVEDFNRLASAFASRGMGVNAVAPSRTSTTHAGVVESYSTSGLPQVLEASLTEDEAGEGCDRDGILDNGEDGILTLSLANVGWSEVAAGTVSVASTTPGVTLSSVEIPAIPLQGEATVSIPVRLDGVVESPAALAFEVALNTSGDEEAAPGTFTLYANHDVTHSTIERVEAPAEELTWTHTHDEDLAAFGFVVIDAAGDQLFYGANTSASADYALVSPALQVGEEALQISFAHFHEFEHFTDGVDSEFYDGAVIELSADGGSTWIDIGDAIVSGPGYGGVIEDVYGNPLGGREGFVGRHHGYPLFQTTTVDLGTTYAGQEVRFRFRVATDAGFSAEGWYIDHIQVNGITNSPFVSFVAEDGVCQNEAPVLTLVGEDTLTGPERSQLTVAVEASDADGDAVAVTWSQVSGPAAILEGADTTEVTVTLPSIEQASAELVLQAIPNDGVADGAPVTVTIVVTDTDGEDQDGAPVVTISSPGPVRAGSNARITANGSDPQGGTLSYTWEQTGGPAAELTPDGHVLWVRTPEVDEATALEFTVTATSSASGLSASATGTLNVYVGNSGGCGGCSSAGAGTLLPAGLAFLAFALRRRRLKV